MLAADDDDHTAAQAMFAELGGSDLLTHSYVVAEASALVQARLGVAAVRALHERLVAPLQIAWIDEQLHAAGVAGLLAAAKRRQSLVDWVSFEVMRRRGIRVAFAFDQHFAAQGFDTIP